MQIISSYIYIRNLYMSKNIKKYNHACWPHNYFSTFIRNMSLENQFSLYNIYFNVFLQLIHIKKNIYLQNYKFLHKHEISIKNKNIISQFFTEYKYKNFAIWYEKKWYEKKEFNGKFQSFKNFYIRLLSSDSKNFHLWNFYTTIIIFGIVVLVVVNTTLHNHLSF